MEHCLPEFSVTAPWAFIWFLDGNENKVDISIVGTNGKFVIINAHGVRRRMGAATEIPGNLHKWKMAAMSNIKYFIWLYMTASSIDIWSVIQTCM